jgi:Na+/melibiose symporter-like transporter
MLMLAGLMMGLAGGTQFGLSAYLGLHFWGLRPQDLSYLVLSGLAGSFIALWAGPWCGARFGKRPTILSLYMAWLVLTVTPVYLRLMGLMPPNGSSLLLAIIVTTTMLGYATAIACHINLGSSVADAIDDITVRTGRRSEGVMFSAYSVLDKWANGAGAFVAGAILSWIAFPTRAAPGTVDPAILRQMAEVAMPIIALGSLGSMAFLSQYGLTREDHERNAAELARRRAQETAEPATAGTAPAVAPLAGAAE